MKIKIIQFIPTLLVLVAISFRYFSLWCTDTGRLCYRTWLDSMFLDVTNPVYLYFLFFLPIAIILAFIPWRTFNSWLKLAVLAIPLSILYVATTPVNFTGIGINFFPFYRDDAARLAGEVFAGASLILVIWKYVATSRRTKNKN